MGYSGDELTVEEVGANKKNRDKATSRVVQFLTDYDFGAFTKKGFEDGLKAVNGYEEIYVKSHYHPEEGPGGSHEWGYTRGHSAYYTYSKEKAVRHLELTELPHGELVDLLVSAIGAYQHIASQYPSYRQKRDAIRVDDLETFRVFEAFLKKVKLTDADFKEFTPKDLDKIIEVEAGAYARHKLTVKRASHLRFAATLKGMEKIKELFPATREALVADFSKALQDVFTPKAKAGKAPDIKGTYAAEGLLADEVAAGIEGDLGAAVADTQSRRKAIESLRGSSPEALRILSAELDASCRSTIEALTARFSSGLQL